LLQGDKAVLGFLAEDIADKFPLILFFPFDIQTVVLTEKLHAISRKGFIHFGNHGLYRGIADTQVFA
jgi:hypothetical protein